MTLLLFGAAGQVGHELRRTLASLGEVVVPERSSYDLKDVGSLERLLAGVSADVVVNAAAYTAVDRAESDEIAAMAVNADAPACLAAAARASDALLVHYSTDYVFDGAKAGPYEENDLPNPLGVYGRSKLAGENAVRASGADHLIIRTSWVYGARGANFLLTILRLAADREELRIVDDQIGAPTWARTIAEGTSHALRIELARRRDGAFESGLLHLTAAGETSWHGFALAIVDAARARGARLKCQAVRPISTAQFPTAARRPANSRLAGDRLRQRYGYSPPAWEAALEQCLDELLGRGRDAGEAS